MNQRDELEDRATDYARGVKRGVEIGAAEVETREQVAYDKGFHDGIGHCARVQWVKLFSVVVVGSVIGCGLVLAVAVGLSNL